MVLVGYFWDYHLSGAAVMIMMFHPYVMEGRCTSDVCQQLLGVCPVSCYGVKGPAR